MARTTIGDSDRLAIRLDLDASPLGPALGKIDRAFVQVAKNASDSFSGIAREMAAVRVAASETASSIRAASQSQSQAGVEIPKELIERAEKLRKVLSESSRLLGSERPSTLLDQALNILDVFSKLSSPKMTAVLEGGRFISGISNLTMQKEFNSSFELLKSSLEDIISQRRALEDRIGKSLEGIDFSDTAAVEKLKDDLKSRGLDIDEVVDQLYNRQKQFDAALDKLSNLIETYTRQLQELKGLIDDFLEEGGDSTDGNKAPPHERFLKPSPERLPAPPSERPIKPLPERPPKERLPNEYLVPNETLVALSAAGSGMSFSGAASAAELFGATYNDVLRDTGLLTSDFSTSLTGIQTELEIARSRATEFGGSLDQALEGVPEEVQKIAESVGGSFIQSLEQGRGVMEAMQEAGRQAAGQMLHYLLQSEQVRGELGDLADVIENVLNQALNGSIDSWEDLGRVALDVLQAIIEKMVEAQNTAGKGGGNGGGILGTIANLLGSFLGLGGGGNALTIGSTPGFSSGGGGTIFTNAGAGIGSVGGTPSFDFAGGFAGGGPLSAGQMALVGEMGPELFVPKVPGHVIPNGALGGGGTMLNITINAPGADREGLESVRNQVRVLHGAVRQLDRSVEPRAVAEVIRQADRGGSFARSVGRRPG